MNTTEITSRCGELQRFWSRRNTKFKEWYDLLSLVDNLKQTGMESYISNDPRTSYNLGLHLLTTSNIVHRIPAELLEPEQLASSSQVEKLLIGCWKRIDRKLLLQGKRKWLGDVASLLLATGWYSVRCLPVDEEFTAEVWNPAQTFPAYGETGLVECSHIYSLTAVEANRRAKQQGWKIRPFVGVVTVYDYWSITEDGVANGVVYGDQLVIPFEVDESLDEIPIFVAPAGGLPDRGAISTGDAWKEQIGQSIVAVNQQVFDNYNRQRTFVQQLMRDTAQPRWIERTKGGAILKPDDVFKRGAIFRLAPGEDIAPLPVPPVPVELRTTLFDIQNEIQRGSFPWMMYGNIQQQVSGYLVSQVAAASQQILSPYRDALQFLITQIDNCWLKWSREGKLSTKLPKQLAKDAEFEVTYPISIPGDMAQRVSLARLADPSFRLSSTTVLSLLFPEIQDPLRELAKVQASVAQQHPVSVTVSLINAFEEQARLAEEAGDAKTAQRYLSAARVIEAQLGGVAEKKPAVAGREEQPVRPREEYLPREQALPSGVTTEMMGE